MESLLKSTEFSLDLAVSLAQAAQSAYRVEAAGPGAFAATAGPIAQDLGVAQGAVTPFFLGNSQGFQVSLGEAALFVFCGSANRDHWLSNFRIVPPRGPNHPWGTAHPGFLAGTQDARAAVETFAAATSHLPHVWLTGHSLGGAMAVLTAAELAIQGRAVRLITFGQPMPGFDDFAHAFDAALPGCLTRVINQRDLVPRLPGVGYQHCGKPRRITGQGTLELASAGRPPLRLEEDDELPPASAEDLESFLAQLEAMPADVLHRDPSLAVNEALFSRVTDPFTHHYMEAYVQELIKLRDRQG